MKCFQLITFSFLFLIFLFTPVSVFAETIRSFDSEIVAHKDGSFDVTEVINYDFENADRHGIYRTIPLVSQVGNLYRVIEINFKEILRDGVREEYSQGIKNSMVQIKIGKANSTISGPHVYKISYLVKNGIGSNYENHDEIYWNATGNEWQVPILIASAKISTDFGVMPDKALCFTGPLGSKNQNCDFSQINTIITTQALNGYEGLTVVWNFPKNTFPPSTLQAQKPVTPYTEFSPVFTTILTISLIVVPVFLNLILPAIILIWYIKNKRKERFGPPAVNFDLPKDDSGKRITPAEAGSIDIHRVDQNDIIATIFDLAIRKYIKIEQVKKSKVLGIFGEDEDYLLIKLKETDQNIEPFEKKLLDSLFETDDKAELSSLKTEFYKTFQEVEKEVFRSLVKKGFYTKNPKNQMAALLALGIVAILFSGIILGLVLIYLSRKLNGRTAKGDEIDWRIDGLKIFLKNMKREYKFHAENLHTVEQLIPYAIAFGFIKEFMDQLKIIYPDYNPSWYRGNMAFYLASNAMMNSMDSSFTTHARSSSSGFSSGGSSGGGGGGGGGGSW